MTCTHTVTQGKLGERGSWCMSCGIKVYDVDPRPCSGCAHSRKVLVGGWSCKKHLMGITPDMNVTFRIAEGTCWEQREYKPLREGQVMGLYMDFDRTADKKWSNAEYLVQFGMFISAKTLEVSS